MDPTTFRMMSGATESFQPVAISFYSSNYYPSYSASITLTWVIAHSASQSINQGIGSINASGSLTVSNPNGGGSSAQRTYQLTALGLDGLSYTSNVTIYWAGGTLVYPGCSWGPPWDVYFCTGYYV